MFELRTKSHSSNFPKDYVAFFEQRGNYWKTHECATSETVTDIIILAVRLINFGRADKNGVDGFSGGDVDVVGFVLDLEESE